MNIVLMMKNKPSCQLVYGWCKDSQPKIKISALVAPPEFHHSAITQEELIDRLPKMDIDLIVSFLYWRIIKEPLISAPKLGCINFHPAPLPEYRGVAPYTKGILNGAKEWAVTAHHIDSSIDTGDIIGSHPVEINEDDTAYSLMGRSNAVLFKLFRKVIGNYMYGKEFDPIKQEGGSYFSKKDFEESREIQKRDPRALIERKTRAYWCPPHEGAYVKVNGIKVNAIPNVALRRM